MFQVERAEKGLLRHSRMAVPPPAQMLTRHPANRHCCLKQGTARAIAWGGLNPPSPHAASFHADASPPFPQLACSAPSWPSLYSRHRSGATVQIDLFLKDILPSGKRLTAQVLRGITGKESVQTGRRHAVPTCTRCQNACYSFVGRYAGQARNRDLGQPWP